MKKITLSLILWASLPNFVNAQCATSSAPTNNCTFGDGIQAFVLNGISATGNSGCGASGYNSFSAPVWTLQMGNTYTWSASVGNAQYNEGVGIWIDLNNDGFYATTEFVASGGPAMNVTGSLTIPITSTPGIQVRMRVRDAYSSSVTSGQACTNGIGFGYGETEDYYVYLVCPSTAPTLTITASNTLVCSTTNSVILTGSGLVNYSWTGGVTNGVVFNPTTTVGYTVTATIPSCPSLSTSAVRTISVNATPTITGISSGSVCPGVSFVMTPGGATTYTYSGGSGTLTGSSATVSPIVTTSYSVVGSSNGCNSNLSSSGFATVTTLASPTLVITAPSPSACPNIVTSLTVTGANTYTWTSPASNQSVLPVSPSVTTIYTVSGTGTNVCNGVKNFTIYTYPSPTITVNSGTLCAGLVFTMLPSGASTYSYANGSNTISPATSTAVNVIGTSTNGCVSPTVAVASITVLTLPVVTVSNGTVCSGSTYVFLPSGATSYTFVNSSNPITPTVSASYSIVGSTTVGCTSLPAIANVTVFNLPTLTVVTTPTNMIICDQSPFILTASGASSYNWNNTATGVTFTGTPSSTGSYFVIGTDVNGCVNVATIPYTVNPLPPLSLTGNTFACLGSSYTLTASGATTYSWTTNSVTNTAVVSPTANTVYGVTGTNTLGCSKTMTLAVKINTIVIAASSNTELCIGNSINISATGGNTYTWSPVPSPFSAVNVTPSVTTTYSYHTIDSKQCDHFGTITVTVNPNPVVIVSGSSSTICAGESATITASGASTYAWAAPSSTTGTSIVVNPKNTTSYMVIGTDSKGCSDTNMVVLAVSKCTGINEVQNQISGLSVYPNPNNGEFTVELNNGLNKLIEVSDVTGRVIVTTQSLDNKTVVNLKEIAHGIYYVKIQSDNSVEVIKVIKN